MLDSKGMNKQHCHMINLLSMLRWVLVDFSNQPLENLLRGPLLHTPQGQVVIVVAIGYLALALLFGLGLVIPPIKSGVSGAIIGCLIWPFIVFLFFVKNGLPSFKPSWFEAAFLAVCSVLPVVLVLWRA